MKDISFANRKKYFYVYYSYEPWGRGYIGKRECFWPPEEDVKYFGSYSDKTFKPTEKIILQTFNSQKEAFAAEIKLHEFYQVDKNPHFANKAKQKETSKEFYNEYRIPLKLDDVNFKNNFIEIVNSSTTLKEVRLKLGNNSTGSYNTIKRWILLLKLDISHFKTKINFLKKECKPFDKKIQNNLIKAVKNSTSLKQVLEKINMNITGRNYESLKSWIKILDLDTSHFTGQGHNRNKKLPKRTESYLEAHHYKYVYTIITPTGEEITTKNLKRFCREYNLNSGCMWYVSIGKYNSHKGYRVTKKSIEKDFPTTP